MQAASSRGIQLLALNGTANHVHCLCKLMPTQTTGGVISQLKTGSESWLNSNQLLAAPFHWDEFYAAYSVSPSTIDKAVEYIQKQEDYHQHKSLEEELEAFGKMVVSLTV